MSTETAVNVIQGLGQLVEVMNTHPTGAALLVLLLAAAAACIRAWRSPGRRSRRRP